MKGWDKRFNGERKERDMDENGTMFTCVKKLLYCIVI